MIFSEITHKLSQRQSKYTPTVSSQLEFIWNTKVLLTIDFVVCHFNRRWTIRWIYAYQTTSQCVSDNQFECSDWGSIHVHCLDTVIDFITRWHVFWYNYFLNITDIISTQFLRIPQPARNTWLQCSDSKRDWNISRRQPWKEGGVECDGSPSGYFTAQNYEFIFSRSKLKNRSSTFWDPPRKFLPQGSPERNLETTLFQLISCNSAWSSFVSFYVMNNKITSNSCLFALNVLKSFHISNSIVRKKT